MEINDIINGLNCNNDNNCGCNNIPGNNTGFGGWWIWIILLFFFFNNGNRGQSPFTGDCEFDQCMCKCLKKKKCCCHHDHCCHIDDCCHHEDRHNSIFGGSWWLFLLVLLFICSGQGCGIGNILGGNNLNNDAFGAL